MPLETHQEDNESYQSSDIDDLEFLLNVEETI